MEFNLAGVQAVSSNKPILKPWEIHEVTFSGVESSSFTGKKDPSKTYKVMKVRFDNKEGSFTETIFYPETAKDTERMKFDNTDRDGKPYTSYMPSNYDRAMSMVAQLAGTINPKGWEKMVEYSDKFTSFDQVVEALKKVVNPYKDKFTTKLKLIGRSKDGKIIAVLPNFVKINRDGKAYIAENFIGDALGFSPTEETKRRAYLNASPTNMPDSAEDAVNNIDETDESIDLDGFDLDV